MPFNGSGGTTQPASSIYPAVANTLIESAKFNISVADIYTMLGSCIVKDGQTTTTQRIPFSAGISVDDIDEKTAGNGVDVDGVLLKDGGIKVVGTGNFATDLLTGICEGRLTLTTATPVTTADVTAAETIYFTPYKGNRIALYDGTNWKLYVFTELSGDVPDANQMNDVFVYDNAGTLTLDIVAWTNTTTRATALATQNGVLVKSGATARRYLGSFYSTTDGNGQTNDSLLKRYVWNYYNRVRKQMLAVEGANTWTYTSATFQQANASAANQLDYVQGVSEDPVFAEVVGTFRTDQAAGSVQGTVGVGVDSTTTNSAKLMPFTVNQAANQVVHTYAKYEGFPGIGKHVLAWIESSTAAGTTTWVGDNNTPTTVQSGIMGFILG